MAYTDELTGLYNRRAFLNHVHRILEVLTRCKAAPISEEEWRQVGARGAPPVGFTIAVFDVNKFKRVNDSYGHATGDEVIKNLAKLLKAKFRRNDILCRWSGDEFIVALPWAKSDPAGERARAILRSLPNGFVITDRKGRTVRVTLSYGVATTAHYRTFEELFDAAEHVMYAAKRKRSQRRRRY